MIYSPKFSMTKTAVWIDRLPNWREYTWEGRIYKNNDGKHGSLPIGCVLQRRELFMRIKI